MQVPDALRLTPEQRAAIAAFGDVAAAFDGVLPGGDPQVRRQLAVYGEDGALQHELLFSRPAKAKPVVRLGQVGVGIAVAYHRLPLTAQGFVNACLPGFPLGMRADTLCAILSDRLPRSRLVGGVVIREYSLLRRKVVEQEEAGQPALSIARRLLEEATEGPDDLYPAALQDAVRKFERHSTADMPEEVRLGRMHVLDEAEVRGLADSIAEAEQRGVEVSPPPWPTL
jgi:hypothetical protein